MHRSARRKVRFVEGDDSHGAIPKDLLAPIYVKVFRAGGVEDGLKEVCCILRGTVLQPLLVALVWGHPSSLPRTGYCVLRLPCDHAALCFCYWLGGHDQMASRGPAAIHDHICDGLLDAKRLDEVPGFGINLFPSSVEVPSTNDQSVPIHFQVHGHLWGSGAVETRWPPSALYCHCGFLVGGGADGAR